METYTKSISMFELTDKDIKDIKNQLLSICSVYSDGRRNAM